MDAHLSRGILPRLNPEIPLQATYIFVVESRHDRVASTTKKGPGTVATHVGDEVNALSSPPSR
jgi:hypothetical protein